MPRSLDLGADGIRIFCKLEFMHMYPVSALF